MKILVVDPIGLRGHINFNKIHIQALRKLDCPIDFIMKEGYGEMVGVAKEETVLSLKGKEVGKRRIDRLFLNRLKAAKDYYKINQYLRKKRYDVVIFLVFDELLFPLITAIYSDVYLINHTNLAGVQKSKIKRWIYKRFSRKIIQIVFDKDSSKYITSLGIINNKIIPHGLIAPFQSGIYPKEYDSFKYIIFSPSRGSIDEQFCEKMLGDGNLIKFLQDNNILLILRSERLSSSNKHILIYRGHLDSSLYKGIYKKASIILAPYPQSFRYRTSGVIMEAIANSKPLLVTDIAAFRVYEEIIGARSYMTSINYLTMIQNKLNDIEVGGKEQEYEGKNKLQPNYSFLLKGNGKN